MTTKDTSRAVAQHSTCTELRAAKIDSSSTNHVPVVGWENIFSGTAECGYKFNSRGLGKVVGLTDRYGRKTGVLVKGIHLTYAADNLTEDDAYPRMDIGLQDAMFDSAILNHLQEEANAPDTSPWEGIT